MTNIQKPEGCIPLGARASSASRESRVTTRRRTLFSGKISWPNGSFLRDCTIIDLSPSGAKIRIGHGQALPPDVLLFDIKNRKVFSAKVIWRKSPMFGLEFLESCDFKEVSSTGIQRLVSELP